MGCIESKEEVPLDVDDVVPVSSNGEAKNTRTRKMQFDLSNQGITMLTNAHFSGQTCNVFKVMLLHNNYLFSLPLEMKLCTALEELHLNGNRFTNLPDILQSLSTLTYLNASNNPLGKPGCVDILPLIPKLETLVLSMCSLRSVPAPVLSLQNLKTLDLSFNESITFDADCFAEMTSLTTLSIGFCAMRGPLPSAIRTAAPLRSLDISGNNFDIGDVDFFGDILGNCLEELKINSHSVFTIPLSFKSLRRLTSLDLSKNPVTSVEGLYGGGSASGEMRRPLRILKLSNCNLTGFPKGIETLKGLKTLDISQNNNFTDSSAKFSSLSNLESLNVVGCLFSSNTDGRDAEWFDIAKLSKVQDIEWSFWVDKGKSSFNPYSTKFPIQLCGMPISKLNGVVVKPNLFTGDKLKTLVNILNDGYYKVDFLFEPQALWHHWGTLKLISALEKGFFYQFSGELNQIRVEVSVWRYAFFLALQSANFDIVLIPPVDVAAVHYSQMTVNPPSYHADCFRIANKLVDCNYRLLFATDGANEEKMRLHRDVWDRMVEAKIRATQRDLFWLKYDYDSFSAVDGGGGRGGLSSIQRPNVGELHLDQVLDKVTVDYFRTKGYSSYINSLHEFFRVSSGFLKFEDHFETQGVELWIRYAKYLTLYATQRAKAREMSPKAASSGGMLSELFNQKLDANPFDVKASATTSHDQIAIPATCSGTLLPVPTLGMHLMLHLHRTTHLKYDRCLEMLNIERDSGIVWIQTREAINATAKEWERVFTEPYLRDSGENINGAGSSVDVEYNMSLKTKKGGGDGITSNGRSGGSVASEGALKSSLAGSKGANSSINKRQNAQKKVTIMTADSYDS